MNRASAANITLNHISIEVNGAATVGTLAGLATYSTTQAVNNFETITIKESSVIAPDSNVGILLGRVADGVTVAADEVNASLKVQSANKVGEDTFVAIVDATFNAPATGNVEIRHPGYIQFREDSDETYAARLVVDWDRDEIQNATEIKLRLSFDAGSNSKVITLDQGKAYSTVKAGDETYEAWGDCALMGFIVTDIPYRDAVTKIHATLIIDGVEIPLGSTEQIPTR